MKNQASSTLGGELPKWLSGKEYTRQCRRRGFDTPMGQEDSLKEGMPVHSSILAWRIPWTEEPCPPMSSHDRGQWATVHGFAMSCIQLGDEATTTY